MISIRVRNFRGCEAAEIELDPIALVAGRNGAGKSSLAQATGAVLTGETLPFGLATKGSAAALVKSGAQEAIVYLKGDNGMAHIEWPACAATSDGDAAGGELLRRRARQHRAAAAQRARASARAVSARRSDT